MQVPALGEDTDRFVADLARTVTRSLAEDWKVTTRLLLRPGGDQPHQAATRAAGYG